MAGKRSRPVRWGPTEKARTQEADAMNRQLTTFDDVLGSWRYIIEHNGEKFIQIVVRHPETGLFDTWVGHLTYIPEVGDEWHEVLNMIRWQGEPYFHSLGEATETGDVLISQWKHGDPPAPPPSPQKRE